LIDDRGINLKPVLAPAIINEKNEKIYGIGVMPKSIKGYIAYYSTGNIEITKKKLKKKLGCCPLVVKAIKSINKSDILISNEDAQRLYLIRHILELKPIVIII
jgi:hypothetical protein